MKKTILVLSLACTLTGFSDESRQSPSQERETYSSQRDNSRARASSEGRGDRETRFGDLTQEDKDRYWEMEDRW